MNHAGGQQLTDRGNKHDSLFENDNKKMKLNITSKKLFNKLV